jgi:hypothetical protein
MTIPFARSINFSLLGRTSTMRFSYTLPSFTMLAVVIMLSTIFWAVPP